MEKLDPKTSALLVMDFQTSIVEMFAGENDGLLARITTVVAAARAAGMRIIYVVVGFRLGYPELTPMVRTAVQGGRFVAGDRLSAVHAAVAPHDGDVVVTKHRVNAFYGTDLDMVLRSNAVTTLVVAGIATSGVVLSTVIHAADADYPVFVV
jgi:nicotinamidase-related amidase